MAAEKPKPELSLETDWVRGWATTCEPSEAQLSYSPTRLRGAGTNITFIRRVMRTGKVVARDKLDGPGAVWVVEGVDPEGNWLRLTLTVVSESQDVRLRDVEVFKLP